MHVSADLSAYLDQELAPAERARVSAHLEGCGRCAAQLADLRATATLMSALPVRRPSRPLVPSLTARWNWLRPIRSLSTVASGAFVMLFLITAVAQSGSDLGGGPATPFSRTPTGPAAAQPAAAPTTADARGAAVEELKLATASPVPAAAPGAAATAAPETQGSAPQVGREAQATAGAEDAAARVDTETFRTSAGSAPPPSPLIWLGFALIAAIVAFTAHRRLGAS